MWISILVFAILNFAALGIGGFLMGGEVTGAWYASFNKAPWTPPGWAFGVAWTLIMVCFSVYMAQAWQRVENRQLLLMLFVAQWILNVAWNPVFFKFHLVGPGLVVIVLLTILVGIFLFKYFSLLKSWSMLVLPYFVWLLVATSLNAYIWIKN